MCLAIPGIIREINGDDVMYRMGKVDFNGITKEVHLGYVPMARVGDYVNVHAGFAIAVLDEKDALEILDIFKNFNQQKQS